MDMAQITSLIQDYNADPRKYTDKEAEAIAQMAKAAGLNFRRESRPLANLAFGFGNLATLGLLPNSFKPYSRGETVYGKTFIDSMASGAGMVAGTLAPIGLGARALGAGSKMLSGKSRDALLNVRKKMSEAGINISDAYNMSLSRLGIRKSLQSVNRPSLGEIQRLMQAGKISGSEARFLARQAGKKPTSDSFREIGRNLGRAGMNVGSAGLTTARTLADPLITGVTRQGARAAQALSQRYNIPYENAVKYLQYSGGGAGSLLGLNMLLGD
jgi:hypothetical protein